MDLAPLAFRWTQLILQLGTLMGGFAGIVHALAIGLLAAVAAIAVFPGRRWSATPVFGGALFLSLFLARLPWFLPVLNPDEAQMLANTRRLLHDPVFWRSVDGTTVGPLDHLPLIALRLVGLPLNFATARLANVLALWAAMVFLYLAARLRLPEWAARLSVLPLLSMAMRLYSSSYPEFAYYASECAPAALTACGVWLLARCHLAVPHRPRAWLWLGLVAACLPFAKLQALPIAAVLIAAGLASALTNPKAARWKSAAWLGAGMLLVTVSILGPVAAAGALRDFYESYLVNNMAYASQAVVNWTPASFAGFVFQTPEMSRFLSGTGLFALAAAAYALWRRKARPSAAHWFAAGLLAAAIFAVWRPGRPAPHYLLLLLVPMNLIAMLALASGLRERARLAGAALAAFTVVLPMAAGTTESGMASLMSLAGAPATPLSPDAERLSQLVNAGDRVAIWGWLPQLYVMTGTVPGTREAQTERQIEPGPQREYYRRRFLRELEAKPPKAFVDAVGPHQTFTDRAAQGYESFPELRQFVDANYEPAGDIQNARLFVRRGEIPPPRGKPVECPLALRCGSDAPLDEGGRRWQGDAYYFGGASWKFHPIGQAAAESIFFSERFCPYSCEYVIPVREGSYAVNLYFVDLVNAAPGKRVFDVTVNGAPALRDFDIAREAGGAAKPIVREIRTAARNGAIRIGLLPKIQDAKINAIEIHAIDGGGSKF